MGQQRSLNKESRWRLNGCAFDNEGSSLRFEIVWNFVGERKETTFKSDDFFFFHWSGGGLFNIMIFGH